MNKLSYATAAIIGLASAIHLQSEEQAHAHSHAQAHSRAAAGQSVADLAQFDVNGDGFVDREEFAAYGDALFEHVDEDGDGAVHLEELEEYHEKATAPEPVESEEDAYGEETNVESSPETNDNTEETEPSEEQLPDEEPAHTEEEVEEIQEEIAEEVAEWTAIDEFNAVDTNGDGEWQLQEVIDWYTNPEWWGEHFDAADADGSQTMDVQEFSAWYSALDFDSIAEAITIAHVADSSDGTMDPVPVDDEAVLEHDVEADPEAELDTEFQDLEISELEYEILAVLNQYRADPTSAIPYIQAQLDAFMEDGYTIDMPSGPNLSTWEGAAAWQEAIDFCREQPALGPLEMSHPLWEAAMSHVLD